MNILVTGGAGYLGSVLVRLLLSEGHEVRVLDRLLYGDEGIKGLEDEYKNYEFQHGDVRHTEDVIAAVQGVDAIIHLAGIVGDEACARNPAMTVGQNYLSTAQLAFVAKYYHIKRFVFASSASVYGQSSIEEPLSENAELNPVSMYAEDKLRSERMLLNMADDEFRPIILRMGTLFGYSPRMRLDLALNTLTARASKQGEFTIFGGTQWRPFLHVEDAARAYMKAITADDKSCAEIYNVSTVNITVGDLGELIRRIVGPDIEINYRDTEKDMRSYMLKTSKVKSGLGWSPVKTIEDGIKEIQGECLGGSIKNIMNPKYSNHESLCRG